MSSAALHVQWSISGILGLGVAAEPQHEYDRFAHEVYSLPRAARSDTQIARFLHRVEREELGHPELADVELKPLLTTLRAWSARSNEERTAESGAASYGRAREVRQLTDGPPPVPVRDAEQERARDQIREDAGADVEVGRRASTAVAAARSASASPS
jgi:hypothetical protein